MSVIERAVRIALECDVRSVTIYQSPTQRVTATRQHKGRRGERATTVLVTVGKLNYAQRRTVARCQKSGSRFPHKPQVKHWKKK